MPNHAIGVRQLIPTCADGSRIMKNIHIAGKFLGFRRCRYTPIVDQILYAIYQLGNCARDYYLNIKHEYRAQHNQTSRQPFTQIENPTNNTQ